MKPTPPEKRPHLLVTLGKLGTVILGILVLIVYLTSHFTMDFFLAVNLITLIISIISMVSPYFVIMSDISGAKIGDMIYHALAAIFILVTASIYLEDVRRITSESKQAFNTINNHISQHFQNLQFEFNVNNEEAIAAGVLALFQAFLYGLVAYVIWRKG